MTQQQRWAESEAHRNAAEQARAAHNSKEQGDGK